MRHIPLINGPKTRPIDLEPVAKGPEVNSRPSTRKTSSHQRRRVVKACEVYGGWNGNPARGIVSIHGTLTENYLATCADPENLPVDAR